MVSEFAAHASVIERSAGNRYRPQVSGPQTRPQLARAVSLGRRAKTLDQPLESGRHSLNVPHQPQRVTVAEQPGLVAELLEERCALRGGASRFRRSRSRE